MRRAALAIALLFVTVSAYAGRLERRETHNFDASGIERLQISHPVGSLEIVGYNGTEIRVAMEVRCSSFRFRCEDKSADIELEEKSSGDTIRLDVEGYPRNSSGLSVELRVEVPYSMSIVLEKGVGDTIIRGLEGDLRVEAGVGSLDIYMSERYVRSIHAESGVGGATLYVDGRQAGERDGFLFLGNEVDWAGEGDSRLDLEVGVGSLRIELD